MVAADEERRLLENVLDGLDDLHDRRERADWWLARLLTATSVALSGSAWERPMADAAAALDAIRLGQVDVDDQYEATLAVTNDLRIAIGEVV